MQAAWALVAMERQQQQQEAPGSSGRQSNPVLGRSNVRIDCQLVGGPGASIWERMPALLLSLARPGALEGLPISSLKTLLWLVHMQMQRGSGWGPGEGASFCVDVSSSGGSNSTGGGGSSDVDCGVADDSSGTSSGGGRFIGESDDTVLSMAPLSLQIVTEVSKRADQLDGPQIATALRAAAVKPVKAVVNPPVKAAACATADERAAPEVSALFDAAARWIYARRELVVDKGDLEHCWQLLRRAADRGAWLREEEARRVEALLLRVQRLQQLQRRGVVG